MASTYFELTDGSVLVGITVSEVDGTLQFQLDVLDDTGTIGDLNGLFFDVADGWILDGLTFEGEDLNGTVVKENSVTKVDSYNNVNGEVVGDYGKFDVGVQFGTSGMATDDIRSTSFTLSSDSMDLTLDMLLAQDFAVRLTSVGEIDGSRDGSVKIGGTAPEEPDQPAVEHLAQDDSIMAATDATFGEEGGFDLLASGNYTILQNDTTDGTPYLGEVLEGNDTAFTDSIIVTGSNGGLLKINADGTVDFAANGDFDYIEVEQSATTSFTYGIEGGATANIDVLVFQFGDPDIDDEDDDDWWPPIEDEGYPPMDDEGYVGDEALYSSDGGSDGLLPVDDGLL